MASGNLRKMAVQLGDEVQYTLNLDQKVDMNALIGSKIKLEWNGLVRTAQDRDGGRIPQKSQG